MRSSQISVDRLKKSLEANIWLVKESEKDLEDGNVAEGQLDSFRLMIFSHNIYLSIIYYSIGNKSQDAIEPLTKAFQIIESCWYDHISVENDDYLFDWYSELIWLLSLGNALNIPLEDFTCAVRAWDKSERRDWLVDYLIRGRVPERELSPDLLFPKPYATLRKAVESKDKQVAADLLKNYLEKEWYQGHKSTYWYNYHLSKRDVFFGYWSLETAVVAKLAGIDDTAFRDCLYYPKDLYSW